MTMSKLTLTAPAEVIALAEKQAKMENTSISAMFTNFILAKTKVTEHQHFAVKKGPLTESLTGIITLPKDFDEKEFMNEIFTEKYGLDK